MKFKTPLTHGKILKRYKRFLADIELENGDVIVAHTANTGSMKTCWETGWPALVSYHDDPKRKLKYTLEMTNNGQTWIGVNTGLPNKLAAEAIKDKTIKELQGYDNLKPEFKVGKSRIDILLYNGDDPKNVQNPSDLCFVEIKNVTMLADECVGIFPDSVSTRGQKHLVELKNLVQQGHRAVMLYIIQREDVKTFSPAKEIDPDYAHLLKDAVEEGVEVLAYQCSLNENEVRVLKRIKYEH